MKYKCHIVSILATKVDTLQMKVTKTAFYRRGRVAVGRRLLCDSKLGGCRFNSHWRE